MAARGGWRGGAGGGGRGGGFRGGRGGFGGARQEEGPPDTVVGKNPPPLGPCCGGTAETEGDGCAVALHGARGARKGGAACASDPVHI